MSTTSTLLEATDESAALEELHRLGCTDGLPVVIPTPERVAAMVLATGLDGSLSLGSMGPALGDATVNKVAACAVMAGCLPDHAPVVIAAVQAVMDPTFDLTEMQATTHATAPMIIINGPARTQLDIACSYGALGPGPRANASIGRALRLAMINIGGGRAGTSDMALLGHPGKFAMCIGEDEEASPFEPLHVARGMADGSSAVTVIGVDAPQSVMGVVDAGDPTSSARLLTSLASGFANVTTNNAALRNGQAVVILNPDHANLLAGQGHDRSSIAAGIAERAVVTGAQLAETAGLMGSIDPDIALQCFADPDDILVLVGGGGGLYSVVAPTWCAGPHRNRAVTVDVPMDLACEIPG